jgi:hypothetical protein
MRSFSARLPDQRGQRPPRPVQSALSGAYTDTELPGRLLHREIQQIHQHNNLALRRRQRRQRGHD